jgi:hypothetical protein
MAFLSNNEYQGWEIYPQNLGLSLLDTNASMSDERLSRLTNELFVEKEESNFTYLNLDVVNAGL